jgi:hypothetical protein
MSAPIRSCAPLCAFFFCGAFFPPYWCLLVGVHVEHCLLFAPRGNSDSAHVSAERASSLTQVSLHLHLFISSSLQVVASRVPNLFDSNPAARIG